YGGSQGIRVVERGGLYIYDTGKVFGIAVEQTAAAFRAERAHRSAGRVDGFRLALGHLQRRLRKHRPGHHRRPGAALAVTAMTERNNIGLAGYFVGNRPAQASSSML